MWRRLVVLGTAAACGSPQPAPAPAPAAAPQPADAMVHRFEHAEEWAKVFDDPSRDAWQQPDAVLAALDLKPNMVVADVGAGTGYFTVRLAKQLPAGRVVATDIEPDMIRYLNERAQREQLGNVSTVLATGDDPKLPPDTLDRALVVDVWHHIADRVGYAKRLADALHPGGAVFVVDFTLAATHGPPAKHRLAPEQIVADLTAAGLVASVMDVKLPEQYIVIGKRP